MVKKIFMLLCAVICAAALCSPAFAEGYYSVILEDMEGLLTDSQEEDLIEIMQSTADKIDCNIGVVITSRLGGKTSYNYTFDFLEEHFGAGSSSIVLLLCEDHINTDWIATENRATYLYGGDSDRIFDALYDGLDRFGYYAAIESFCNYLAKHDGGSGSSSGGIHLNRIDIFDLLQSLFVPFIIALITSLITTVSVMSGYKKKAPISARRYMDDGRTRFIRREDVFVREFTTSHRVSSSSSGGHGGRGGGGGRSRSGRGGGGGRRR